MLIQHLKIAFLELRKHKFAAVSNVLCLAIGLTAFICAFVVTGYLQNSDTQFADAERIYLITAGRNEQIPAHAYDTGSPQPLARYLRTAFPELPHVARAIAINRYPVSMNERSFFQNITYVDAELLSIFNFSFLAGDAENALDRPDGAVITRAAALRYFDSVDVVGRIANIGGLDIVVTGVVDDIVGMSHFASNINNDGFDFLVSLNVHTRIYSPQVAAAMEAGQKTPEDWYSFIYTTYVLLPADGSISPDQFNRRLDGFVTGLPNDQIREYSLLAQPVSVLPALLLNRGLFPISLLDLPLLLGGLLLCIASLNVANLALTQTIGRFQEMGMRKVIGASRKRILMHNMCEILILCLVSLLVALLVSNRILHTMSQWPQFDDLSLMSATTDLAPVLGVVSTGVFVVVGIVPALILAKVRPMMALHPENSRLKSVSWRQCLVGMQFFATSFLLICIIVIYSQSKNLRETVLAPATDPNVVLEANIRVGGERGDLQFLRERLLADSSILRVSGSNPPPWSSDTTMLMEFQSRQDTVSTGFSYVGYDYFALTGLELLAGRTFSREFNDRRTWRNERVINTVIDRRTAERLGWTSPADAVGELVSPSGFGADYRIIGVVENTVIRLTGSDLSWSYQLAPDNISAPVVQLSGQNIAAGLAHIENTWREFYPEHPLVIHFMDEIFDQSYSVFNRITQAVFVLSAFAVFISFMALFAMAHYTANRRRHEIGIRKTIGANLSRITRQLLWEFCKPVLLANLIAWPFAFFAMRAYLDVFTQRIELGISPFILSMVLCLFISALAVGSQTIQAARVKPATVLRYE